MQFENNTVLVTGGASGIGFLTAKCFAQEGASVAIVDFDQKGLDKALSELKQVTDRVIGFPVDVRNYAMVEEAAQETVSKFGSIDVLVACAGGAETRIIQGGAFYELPIEVVDWGIDVNLKGALYFDHVAMKQMVKQKSGVIINIGSMWGKYGASMESVYSAAKGAVRSFTLALAKELGPSGVTVNCVEPGVIDTDMNAVLSTETLAGLADETPLCRLGRPEEVAAGVLFLASPEASYITGQFLGIDGGI